MIIQRSRQDRMETAFTRFLEITARRDALAECLSTWRRAAENSSRQRGDAMFDAMGEQMQLAQCKSQNLEHRCAYLYQSWHLQEADFLTRAVVSAWRSGSVLRRARIAFAGTLDSPVVPANTAHVACAFVSWRCEVLDAVLLRLRGSDLLDAALLDCTSITCQTECLAEGSEEDDLRSAGNTGFIHRHGALSCAESVAFSDMTGIKMSEDDTDHPGLLSCARKLCFTSEKAQHSSRSLMQSQSVEFLLSGMRKEPTAGSATSAIDQTIPRQCGERSASLTMRTQNQQWLCQSARQAAGASTYPDKCSEGGTLVRPQRRQPFAPCQEIASPSANTSEPKRLKGPERFFYDTSSYTGCARFGGPTVVDRKENRGMNVDAMPKRGSANLPSSVPSSSPGVSESLRSAASHAPLR